MNDKFRREQKQPPVTSIKLRRELTAAQIKTERKNKRGNVFNQHRSVVSLKEPELEMPVKDVRARQLQAWKRAREESEMSNKKKRKPFIVSVVHHNIGSPYKKRSPFKPDAQLKPTSSKKQDIPRKPAAAGTRVTRATSRAAKLNETVVLQKKNDVPKLAPSNFKFKAPKGIAPLPLSTHKLKKDQEQTKDLKIILTPMSLSMEKNGEQTETVSTPPSVTKRSGAKGSTKKAPSIKKKTASPLSSKRKLNYSTPKPKMGNLVVELVPCDKGPDVSQYRKELDSVIERLENLCSKWSFTQEQTANLPKEVNDMVDVATGQTKLLIKEKLAQYRGLIDECERNNGSVRVTESDLQGFWAMVNLQVENVNSKFEKLDVLKDNNWREPEKLHTSPLKKKKGATKVTKTKQVVAKSSVRDHIAALRRAKAAIQSSEPKDTEVSSSVSVDTASQEENQSIQRGKFTPVVMLIRTQLSEKQKRNSRCSTALMKITNHLREISTPETGKKANTKAIDGSKSRRRISNRNTHLTPDVLNTDKKAEFEPHITPPNKTYSKSPMKSSEVADEDKQFELLRKTPTFMHSSPTTKTSKEMLREGTPRATRQRRGIRS